MNRPSEQAACPWRDRSNRPSLRNLGETIFAVWLHDSSPGTRRNDACRDSVGRASEPAHDAFETCPCGTIRLVHVPTGQARTTGFARIYGNNRHTGQSSLVRDERSKLGEGPIRVSRPLALANRYPVADAPKVFQSDAAPGALRDGNDTLADAVVGIPLEAGLRSPDSPEFAASGLGSLALKIASPVGEKAALSLDGFPRVHGSIGVDGEVHDAKIQPQVLGHGGRRWLRHVHGNVQVKLAVSVDQVGLPPTAIQPSSVPGTEDRWEHRAAVEREQADELDPLPCHDPLVVRDCSVRTEVRSERPASGVRFNHFGYGSDGQLGRQAELGPDLVVHPLVQGDFVGAALAERHRSNRSTRGIESLHSRQQGGVLFGRWPHSQGHYQPHPHRIELMFYSRQEKSGCAA
jgi:hypothetical protein